jgi:hypothetical protein
MPQVIGRYVRAASPSSARQEDRDRAGKALEPTDAAMPGAAFMHEEQDASGHQKEDLTQMHLAVAAASPVICGRAALLILIRVHLFICV